MKEKEKEHSADDEIVMSTNFIMQIIQIKRTTLTVPRLNIRQFQHVKTPTVSVQHKKLEKLQEFVFSWVSTFNNVILCLVLGNVFMKKKRNFLLLYNF